MLLKKYILLLACLALVITSCSDDDDTAIVEVIEVTSGSADVSRYVAIGNSLTSGFTDGALFIAGQINSFPNTLSKQFSAAGGGVFTQPLMNDNIGGALLGGNQIFNPRLFFDGSGPALLPQTPTTEIANIKPGPYNNMGIPGAKSFHLLSNSYGNLGAISTGQANPYFVRMASSPSASVLQDAMAQSPTFFSIWIGNNDVLSYSSSGGDGTDQTGNPDPSTYGSNDITDPGLFANVYAGIVNGMVSSGATEGVVLNIPDVTSIPFFTTIPHNPIPLDGPTAGAVNTGYAPYNGGLQAAFAALTGTGLFTAEELAKRTINFTAGQNAVVIVDESLTDLGAINPAFSTLPKLRQ
ncbi:MAG: G-D-S-L family lipolytic protein, partial [Flavobacteriaceae bacterium]|nr:G-D-S-L family lipolytic protein [Flavobacteriaceae bacterium]